MLSSENLLDPPPQTCHPVAAGPMERPAGSTDDELNQAPGTGPLVREETKIVKSAALGAPSQDRRNGIRCAAARDGGDPDPSDAMLLRFGPADTVDHRVGLSRLATASRQPLVERLSPVITDLPTAIPAGAPRSV